MDVQPVLRYPGAVDADGTLQILLVSSSQQYLEKLQMSLYTTRESQEDKRTYNLNVHICKSISDIFVNLSPDEFKVDYVVFIIDMKNCSYFEELEVQLKSLKPFFGNEKLCLINPDPANQSNYFQPDELWDFVKSYQLNMINGKILDDFKIGNVSNRILNLAESCCGITNGVPLKGLV